MEFNIAAKAFIMNDKRELLLIKRVDTDAHKPGTWEVPGGRVEENEDLIEGLIRETKEETGLIIEALDTIKVHNFTREDGIEINMTTFLCRQVQESSVVLSEEHSEHCWINIHDAISKIIDDFHDDVSIVLSQLHHHNI